MPPLFDAECIEAGSLEVRAQSFDLSALVARLAESYGDSAVRKRIQLELYLPPQALMCG